MNRTNYALGIAALAGLLPAAWLISSAMGAAADSPVTVSDGSIVIENPGGDLSRWTVVNRTTMDHPQAGKSMGAVEVTGPGATNATCAGRGRCVVEMRWSSGQAIRAVASQGGSRGLRLEAAGVTFDDPAWNKASPAWRFQLPGDAVPTATIRDLSTNNQPETICQGKGCKLTVHYR